MVEMMAVGLKAMVVQRSVVGPNLRLFLGSDYSSDEDAEDSDQSDGGHEDEDPWMKTTIQWGGSIVA
ncbi:hypothetical protein PF005_g17081 [Phytophthora fragariae]|uniref:Uncharacterized protein n=1 Tax=Phytophthora fragariae TaxID=53985 RepID=A0A6A3ECV2_9STRA|nr:hypothetical protein PF003_g15408 [Phytophthora fragariae]KAE8931385.1 hypothetical protein PF009_g18557 [Phytophthora fragariae]KAE8995120.1 hypothetical protein PF011_g16461 [Phytophthora fragariae]KAE9095494.1 hypothetical protein PF010_g16686 [Phytophthora fragariae]KAE9095888.1 hypothetical protein PF007_g17219 [Phytophthora fragariae]